MTAQLDAQLTWDTWRRILRDDPLAERVSGAANANAATIAAAFTPAERAILADYASTPRETDTNIGMYRRGLVRNALAALARTPMSQHLLYASGLVVDAVAQDFARATGYADLGPRFWQLAGAFVEHLAARPEFAAPAPQDAFALDRALVALARRLADAPPARWPADAATAGNTASPDARFVANRAATIAATGRDLTTWIEDPHGFDPAAALDAAPRHWLVYFPSAESAPAYAELTARSARIVELLAVPSTAEQLARALDHTTPADALRIIERLSSLGIVARAEERLDDDSYVVLDPAVELLDVEVGGHRLLCHHHVEVGMAIPPGGGLVDFVAALADRPVRLGALRRGFDDQRLVDAMVEALRQHGFLHAAPPHAVVLSTDELAHLRHAAADLRGAHLSRTIAVDLDLPASAERIRALVAAEANAPSLRLSCARLADRAGVLADLAELRLAGWLRVHHTVVECVELAGAAEAAPSLRALGADVMVTGVAWPAPIAPIAGLDELARAGIAVSARTAPDRSVLDGDVLARAVAWARSAVLTGLALELDADRVWPDGAPPEADFVRLFEAVHAFEIAFGDVHIANLPHDEVLLGNAHHADDRARLTDTQLRFRTAYLRWRIPRLKLAEGDNTFSQTPDAEEKLVRRADDLLPNHPELLGLAPGALLVDVCGGNGRVARRLAPHVGADGAVISVELLRCVTDRARRFASDLGFTNIQFRTGLAERLPLPDGAADAAVNEWTGAIWQLGLGPKMLAEMARVVRVGGRVAVTHRLVRLSLERLAHPWVQFDHIYTAMREAFARADLKIVVERIWGQTASTLVGEKASAWRKHYLPRLVNPFDVTYTHEDAPGPHADVCLTLIAERIR